MFSKKKKIIILSVMVALLVVTGYLNIALNNNVSQTTSTQTSNLSFYDGYRADRKTARDSEILYCEGVLADSTSSQEAKDMAEKRRDELIGAIEIELAVEGLIKGLGYEDAVLTASNNNINLIIKAKREDLTEPQLAKIETIIKEQTKRPLTSVRVIPSEWK